MSEQYQEQFEEFIQIKRNSAKGSIIIRLTELSEYLGEDLTVSEFKRLVVDSPTDLVPVSVPGDIAYWVPKNKPRPRL